MYSFYSRIPAAAVRREFDGKDYGLCPHRMDGGRIIETSGARMLRVAFVTNGEAYCLIGRAGDAIAQHSNLPFAVTAHHAAFVA